MKLLPRVDIVISGPHDSGRTTLAHVIENFLQENGYKFISVKDTPPLPQEQKAAFWDRFTRNRDLRPVEISVKLDETMTIRLTHRRATDEAIDATRRTALARDGRLASPSPGALMIAFDERGEQRVAAYAEGDPANPLAYVFWPHRRRWTGPRKVQFFVWPGQAGLRMAEAVEVALARTVPLPDGSLPR
jgi:hypothetical protein